jgi:hypothetical protein
MTIKFQIGKTYNCRSICDHDCIWSFSVTARSEKTVVIHCQGKIDTRRKVRVRDGIEEIDPVGRYSMAPVLRADKVAS